MVGETKRLASFVANLRLEDVPPAVQAAARNILVDQIGVQIGCSHFPWARQVRDIYRNQGGAAEATTTRYGDRLPLSSVAFVNGTFGHSFEYDDANPLVHGHPGAELIPALLATGEREHASGAEFLTSFIAAYELRGRIGWALSPDMHRNGGPQYSTVCGPFGAAAGSARLLGLSEEQIHHAIGIAGCYTGGLMQYALGGGSAKRIFTAVAASSGVQAALLAHAGITGPDEIIEGDRGLLKIYGKSFYPERLTDDLGSRWTLDHALFKPYACCAAIHPAIDATQILFAAHGLDVAMIDRIEVGHPSGVAGHVGRSDPKDILGMQMSTAFSLACTMLKGANTPEYYNETNLADEDIIKLATKISVSADARLDELFLEHMPAAVAIYTKNGGIFETIVTDAKGSTANPLSVDEIDTKFATLARPVLGTMQSDTLLKRLRAIEDLADIADLVRLMVPTDEL